MLGQPHYKAGHFQGSPVIWQCSGVIAPIFLAIMGDGQSDGSCTETSSGLLLAKKKERQVNLKRSLAAPVKSIQEFAATNFCLIADVSEMEAFPCRLQGVFLSTHTHDLLNLVHHCLELRLTSINCLAPWLSTTSAVKLMFTLAPHQWAKAFLLLQVTE